MMMNMRVGLSLIVERALASGLARRFVRQQDGATTVEFALIVAPFMALIFAIIQTAIVFFAGQTLETANADTSRLIMTGQAQQQGFSQAQYKNQVCARIYGLFNCQSGLYVDVKTYTAFSGINNSQLPIDANGNLQTSSFGYQPGGPGDIVVVRLVYQWPEYVSLLGLHLANSSNSSRVIMSTVAFRNEPYSVGP